MHELSSEAATVIHLTQGRSTTVTSSDLNKRRELESRIQQQSELIALMKKRSDDLIHQVLLRLDNNLIMKIMTSHFMLLHTLKLQNVIMLTLDQLYHIMIL